MCGNLNRRPIGRCSQCNGIVSLPNVWMSVNRPVPFCESCGAMADMYSNLPVIPTIPVVPHRKYTNVGKKPEQQHFENVGYYVDHP